VDFHLTAGQQRLQHKCRELAADFASRSAACMTATPATPSRITSVCARKDFSREGLIAVAAAYVVGHLLARLSSALLELTPRPLSTSTSQLSACHSNKAVW